MTLSDDLLAAIENALPPLFDCRERPRGDVRVRTPMQYPDGGFVDVFVVGNGGASVVTDYGDALGWLRMNSASSSLGPRQRELIEDVMLTLSVEMERGQLRLSSSDALGLADAVQRVAQAAARVASVWAAPRSRSNRAAAGTCAASTARCR